MVRAVHAIAACAPLCPIASISAFKPAPPEGAKTRETKYGWTHGYFLFNLNLR
ncbi:hypothetical protein J558_0492 [Acinetobacter baumannii 1106579]|nr:hypothetical protein J558_0492 [Acinetobacter baumannii 1106579]